MSHLKSDLLVFERVISRFDLMERGGAGRGATGTDLKRGPNQLQAVLLKVGARGAVGFVLIPRWDSRTKAMMAIRVQGS